MGRKKRVREQSWSAWIDSGNSLQVQWAFRYLRKKGFKPPHGSGTSIPLSDLKLPDFASLEEQDRFIDLMKRAWKAKKTRDRAKRVRGVRAFHVYLSNRALTSLDNLSATLQRPKNALLELLIIRAASPEGMAILSPVLHNSTRTSSNPGYLAGPDSIFKSDSANSQPETDNANKIQLLAEEVEALKGQLQSLLSLQASRIDQPGQSPTVNESTQVEETIPTITLKRGENLEFTKVWRKVKNGLITGPGYGLDQPVPPPSVGRAINPPE